MQLELFDDPFDACEPEPEPASSGVPYVRRKGGRKPGPGAVPCNAAGGCTWGLTAARSGGALVYGGLCGRHGREKRCGYRLCGGRSGCGNLATHGICDFEESGESDPSVLLCDACYEYERSVEKSAKLGDVRCQGDSGECLKCVDPKCLKGVNLCQTHNRNRLRGHVPCVGPECVLLSELLVQTDVPGGQELCQGHYEQVVKRGDPLTPLGSTYTKRDYNGCALYLFRGVLPNGATVDVFGVTEPAVELRLSSYEGMSRGRPGLEITEVYGWWRWDDKQTARTVEKKLAELAVHNRSLRRGLKTESWPADDGKVRVALATVMRYSPDYTSKGDE